MPFVITPQLNEIRSEIQPAKLEAKGFPRPMRVSLIEGVDSEGEHAYHIYLVYPKNTPEARLAWDKIERMVSFVRKYVWDNTGQKQWPYVWVKKEQDLPPELHG